MAKYTIATGDRTSNFRAKKGGETAVVTRLARKWKRGLLAKIASFRQAYCGYGYESRFPLSDPPLAQHWDAFSFKVRHDCDMILDPSRKVPDFEHDSCSIAIRTMLNVTYLQILSPSNIDSLLDGILPGNSALSGLHML